MKNILLIFSLILTVSCANKKFNPTTEREAIELTLNNWHKAAAEAQYDNYFKLMDNESVFMGTDATENWNKDEFMKWSKPYFDRGRAWNFSAIERNIYFNSTGDLAWFDELLNTQMKICRGSGVLAKNADGWKIKQYVLSTTIPNEIVNEVTLMKTAIEDSVMQIKKQ